MRAWWVLGLLLGCEAGAGDEGTALPVSLAELSGGVVFATAAVPGADGYDLLWAPLGGSLASERSFLPLTRASGDETQPSIAPDGRSLAFVREGQGILLADEQGDIRRVSDVRESDFVDSLPAVSADGDRVAWVRRDTRAPIRGTNLVETQVWVANRDGSNARPVNPRPGVIQDAPAFDPTPQSARLAFTEFSVRTLGPRGPVDYGVWLHDLELEGGRYLCEGAYELPSGRVVRCFGQHLAWPEPRRLVLPQELLEFDPTLGPTGSSLDQLLAGIGGTVGAPDRTASPSGFFPPFPVSGSFRGDVMVVDGVYRPFDGDNPTLSLFIAGRNGENPFRFRVAGHRFDLDPGGTAGYLFSLATPQIVP